MNPIRRAILGAFGGLREKKVGNQLPLVERYRDGLPLWENYSIRAALEKDIKRNPFLYTALKRKSEAIAQVPFYVEEYRNGEWVRVPNHPAENLIENANPFMSGWELKEQAVYHKELSGSAFFQIVSVPDNTGGRVKKRPVFLQPLFPQFMRVIPSRDNFIGGFEYSIDGEKKVIPADEVFWTKYPDPSDPYKGLSPLEAVNEEIQTDLEARRWNKVSLANRGASDVAFIMRSVTTEEQYEFARKMIEDRMSGPDNARRPWVLGGDSDVRPMSYNAVEMDYIDTRKFNREVIAAALGVPAPLIGDADNSTYNNLDTLKKEFWQGTITTWLENFRQDLTRQILIPYYGDGRVTKAPTIRYMYDLSNVEALVGHTLEKAETAKTLREAGFSLRAINQLLEFGVDMDAEDEMAEAERERTATIGPEPDDDDDDDVEDTARDMVRAAMRLRDNEGSFVRAIRTVADVLSKGHADEEMASNRARMYLAEDWSLGEIVRNELASRHD